MANQRLDSWKEIAAHLRRDVTTVRRWEKREGLPVHRHLHERRESVYAYSDEIDHWLQARHTSRRRFMPALVAAGALLALLVAVVGFMAGQDEEFPSAPNEEVRFQIAPPRGTSIGAAAISPDGQTIAFVSVPAAADDTAQLWIRRANDVVSRPLRDTEGAAFPFWSPSSDTIAFFSDGAVWTIGVNGGSPRRIAAAPAGRGGSWSSTGALIFAPDADSPLHRVSASGGPAEAITTVVRPQERGHVWPEFLPDGRRFLYLAETNDTTAETHQVYLGSLDGAARQQVVSAASNVRYSPSGHLLYQRDRRLLAQPFDRHAGTVSGEPIPVLDRLQQQPDSNHRAEFSISSTGRLTYLTMQSPASRLTWRDRRGSVSLVVQQSAEYFDPTLSPDDHRIAVDVFDPEPSPRFGYGVVHVVSDIVLLDSKTGAQAPLTKAAGTEWGPVWSPGGQRLIFTANRDGREPGLFVKSLHDGVDDETQLLTRGRYPVAHASSPDGRYVLYSSFTAETRTDLWLLPMMGDAASIPLLATPAAEWQGQISPDGRWLAYTSDESGRNEVYVTQFPQAARRWQVSLDGGADPRWRGDGRELFYVADAGHLMALPVEPGATFDHGTAVILFDVRVRPGWYNARNVYDVTNDGRRFVVLAPVEDASSIPLTVVLNWPGRLRK